MVFCRLPRRRSVAAGGAAALLAACSGAVEPPPVAAGTFISGQVLTAKGEPASGIAVFVRRVEALQDTLPGRCSRTTTAGADGDAVFARTDGAYQSFQPWGAYCVHLYAMRDGRPVRLSVEAVEVNYANTPEPLNGRLPAGAGRWEMR